MSRAVRKTLFWILATIALIVAVLLLNATVVLDYFAERYRNDIEAAISDALQSEVTVGALKVGLRPLPQISAENVFVHTDPNQKQGVRLEHVTLRLHLRPLLEGKFDFHSVSLGVASHQIELDQGQLHLSEIEFQAETDLFPDSQHLREMKLNCRVNGLLTEVFVGHLEVSNAATAFLIEDANAKIGASSFSVSGSYDNKTSQYKSNLSQFKFQVAALQPLLKLVNSTYATALRQGELSGALIVEGQGAESLTARGNLYGFNVVGAGNYSLKNLKLEQFEAQLAEQGQLTIKTKLDLSEAKITDREFQYRVSQAKGPLVYSSGTNTSDLSGQLNVLGFSYYDGLTDLHNVNATLSPLKVVFAKSGVSANIKLQGTSLKLKHPSIEIFEVKTVDSPLIVSVPAAGGYKITGPVSARDLRLTTMQLPFQKISGTVDLSISEQGMSFKGNALKFIHKETPGELSADFRISPSQYQLVSASTDYFAGGLSLSAALDRSSRSDQFNLKLDAKELSLPRVLSTINSNWKEKAFGKADFIKLQLAGKMSQIKETLAGNGEFKFTMEQASRLRLSNALVSVLREVPVVGVIFGSNKSSDSKDQQLTSAKIKIQKASCLFEDLKLTRPNYNLVGAGTLGFDGKMDFKADVYVLEETASSLGLGIGPLKQLFGRVGRVLIPIKVGGIMPDYKIEADIKAFIKNYSGLGLGESLINGIGGLFSTSKSKPAATGSVE